MKIGITGHQELDDPAAWKWVEEQLSSTLVSYAEPLTGISSLAIGADQYFAKIILELGYELRAILPFENYEEELDVKHRQEYLQLLQKATSIKILTGKKGEEAFFQAGQDVVNESDVLMAVWDGKPAAGLGGTADIVNFAIHNATPVIHINPISYTVTEFEQFDL